MKKLKLGDTSLQKLEDIVQELLQIHTPAELEIASIGSVQAAGCNCGGGCSGSCAGRCGGCGGSSCKGGLKIF
jgi:hypothetical protein